MGDLGVVKEWERAILYSFSKRHVSLMLVEDRHNVLRSIFLRSESLHAVVRASKKEVLMHKSRIEMKELSPRSRIESKEGTISIGLSE